MLCVSYCPAGLPMTKILREQGIVVFRCMFHPCCCSSSLIILRWPCAVDERLKSKNLPTRLLCGVEYCGPRTESKICFKKCGDLRVILCECLCIIVSWLMIVVIYFVSCTVKVYDIGYFCVYFCVHCGDSMSIPKFACKAVRPYFTCTCTQTKWPVLRLHKRATQHTLCLLDSQLGSVRQWNSFLIELPAKIVCKSPCCVRDSLWSCWQVTEE